MEAEPQLEDAGGKAAENVPVNHRKADFGQVDADPS